uniref:Integrase catalytic domain-containing protein n=1 Tax=Heterorhabditis bacteriophora TaxID=37862 RepID=A0A1I7WIC1_HETBA
MLRLVFAQHGMSETVVSDSGIQFSSTLFSSTDIKKEKESLKRLFKNFCPIIDHHQTHLFLGTTPPESLMGRCIRIALDLLRPARKTNKLNDRVYARAYNSHINWQAGIILKRCGLVMYDVQVGEQCPSQPSRKTSRHKKSRRKQSE